MQVDQQNNQKAKLFPGEREEQLIELTERVDLLSPY